MFATLRPLAEPGRAAYIQLMIRLTRFIEQLPNLNVYALAVGLLTLATGVATRKFLPRLPYMIIAMLVGSLFAALVKAVVGDNSGVATVSAVPRSLPPPAMPDLFMATLRELAAVALALTMPSLTEAIAIARAIAVKSGQRIDNSQEYIGQGLANLFGSFASAYVSSGSSRTAASTTRPGRARPWHRCSLCCSCC